MLDFASSIFRMCFGIPMQVLEITGAYAWCAGRGYRESINMLLLPDAVPGDWIYVALGLAREFLTPQSAEEINLALDGLVAISQGQTELDVYFPSTINVSDVPLAESST